MNSLLSLLRQRAALGNGSDAIREAILARGLTAARALALGNALEVEGKLDHICLKSNDWNRQAQ